MTKGGSNGNSNSNSAVIPIIPRLTGDEESAAKLPAVRRYMPGAYDERDADLHV